MTVGDPAALSEKPFSGLAIDREGYIAARQLTGDWRISRLTTSKVLAAAFHPTGGLLFATEAGELLVTATGYDFEEITQPSGEGKVLALAYSEVATVFFVLFEGNRLGIYQDGEFTIEDLSSYSQLADSPKMYYTAGTLALWDPSVAHTAEVKIVSVNIYTTVPTIGAHTFATIAGTKYIHTFTHDFELRGYILADSASDTANCDLYLAKGTASATLISSFYLTEGRPAIIARSNIRYLDETLVGPHGTAETVVFTTPGSLLKAELPSLVSDPLTTTAIPAMWGAKASAIVRTLNHTSIYFEDNNIVYHQANYSPYYGFSWLRSKPYEKANRGFIAAAGVKKSELPLVVISNLPCPAFIVKGTFPEIAANWEFKHAGDSVYAYQWAYTYYNEKDRTESRPSPVSAEIAQTALGNASATVILRGSEDSQVTHIRLYRIGGLFTEFTLVEELANEDQIYIDYLFEPASIVVMRTDDNYPPPLDGLLGLTYYNSRFYSLRGLRLYFTDDSVNPNYWPPENYITLPDEGTGLVATAFGLYIFTERTITVLTGQGPIDAILTTVDNTVGTGYTDTILSKGNTVFFLAKDGVYQINGLEVSCISQTQLDEGTEFNAVNAVFYRSQLLAQLEDRVLVLDLRYLPTWKHLDFGTSRLITGNGQLLAIKGGDTIELFKHEDDAELHYLSPRYVETGVTVLKSYNVMYIASQGEFELSVFVDGEKVVEELELASKYVQEVQIPLGARRGYDIQLELKGKGEVYEIEWLPKMREKQ